MLGIELLINIVESEEANYVSAQSLILRRVCMYYVIKLHLESLPSSIPKDAISCYMESQGDNVEVISVNLIGCDEVTVELSGLTDHGNVSNCKI